MIASRTTWASLAVLVVGVIGCVIGAVLDPAGFCRASLCSFVLWLGLPLAGAALVLSHDLTGGEWMASARPVLNAALMTMPLASLAGVPAFIGLHSLYGWTHPAPSLGNTFYLNGTGFVVRYVLYLVLWNAIAGFALWGPRGPAQPIVPSLSWISGVALIVLALSASFAAIDWVLSLEPGFWSSIFPISAGASWFITGMSLVLLVIACRPATPAGHRADLAAILLATVMLWAYAEFMQFLIIWEGNLKSEIPWYLLRIDGVWRAALLVAAGLGFVLPFFLLLTAPGKHSRAVVAIACLSIVISRVAERWWLILPEYQTRPPLWLDAAAVLALGGAMILMFLWGLHQRVPRLLNWAGKHA